MSKTKFCKDCEHCKRHPFFFLETAFFRCKLKKRKADLLDGHIEYQYCSIVRSGHEYNTEFCGTEAKWFEQKDEWWKI